MPEILEGYSLLIDLRQASGKNLTTAGVRALTSRELPLAPGSRIAVVVPSEFGFGVARMYEAHRGERSSEFRPFRDLEEDRRWIAEDADPR